MDLGIIGDGNMGSSILKGVTTSNFLLSDDVAVFDLNQEKVEKLVKEYGVKRAETENELVEKSNIIILSVKPNIIPIVLKKIKDKLDENTIENVEGTEKINLYCAGEEGERGGQGTGLREGER